MFVTLSHCVYWKKNICHTESLCLSKNCQKWSKTVKIGQKLSKTVKIGQFLNFFLGHFLTFFDQFWPFFLKHSDSVWQTFFSSIKHIDSVWQFFSFLNTVTQCDKHFFRHSDISLAVNFFKETIWKFGYLSNINFNIEEKLV